MHQLTSSSLYAKKPTSRNVHRAIQGMELELPYEDTVISLCTIANELHMDSAELNAHISTLQNLCYIRFTDRKHQSICLTYAGRHTVVPVERC